MFASVYTIHTHTHSLSLPHSHPFPFLFHFPHFSFFAFSLFSLHPILCVPLLRQSPSMAKSTHKKPSQSLLSSLLLLFLSVIFVPFLKLNPSFHSFIPQTDRDRDREREQPQPIPSIWSTPKIYTKTKPPPTCPPTSKEKRAKKVKNYNQLHSSNKGETTNKPK